jgi:hypothetical protein
MPSCLHREAEESLFKGPGQDCSLLQSAPELFRLCQARHSDRLRLCGDKPIMPLSWKRCLHRDRRTERHDPAFPFTQGSHSALAADHPRDGVLQLVRWRRPQSQRWVVWRQEAPGTACTEQIEERIEKGASRPEWETPLRIGGQES